MFLENDFCISCKSENESVCYRNLAGFVKATAAKGGGNILKPLGLGTTAAQLTNRWELQGKERDLTFGLNRINFGARVYNPTIGEWDQVDPLAETYANLSPYQYVANNPLRFIDPDGRETWDVWGATTFSGYAGDDGSGTIVGRTPGKEGNEDPGKGQKKPEGKTEKKRWDHGLVPVYSSYLDGKEAESRGDYASMVGHSFVAALEFVSMALTYGESGIMISGVRQGVVKGAAKTSTKLSTRFVSTADNVVHDLKPTLDRIASGGKFPHRNDGSIFKNMEGLLPKQNAGYYREFVHPTPGAKGPGAMRVVTGQGGEMWFTPDHYKTFIPIR